MFINTPISCAWGKKKNGTNGNSPMNENGRVAVLQQILMIPRTTH
jgi:hypothetical protein